MNLYDLSVRDAREGLRKRELSALELTRACLERIQNLDKTINAFITITDEHAIEHAKKADALIAIGEDKPLLGIPYTIKDVFNTYGIKTSAGSNILTSYISPYSATVFENISQAGGILLGKTNCDAFGHGSSTENSDFGVTVNPWDTTKVAGGSSGGSAASLAYGGGLFSIAEDTGGSIRQPAAFCSITGLKPTWGLVSRYGCIAYASSLDTIGPMVHEVQDLATIMEVIGVPDPQDISQSKQLPRDWRNFLRKRSHLKLTIGLPREFFGKGNDREIDRAIDAARTVLERGGHRFRQVSLPHTAYAIECYYLIATAEASSNLARYDGIRFGKSRDHFNQENKRRIMLGTFALSSGYMDKYYTKAMQVRSLIMKDIGEVFAHGIDCLLAPVSPVLPFKIGEKAQDPLQMYLADAYTVPINVAGVPSLALPCGFSKSGLPIGMQIIGNHFSEALLFGLGSQYQRMTDWHTKRPVI